MKNSTYCIIMAGGIGSRFWPMSTQKYPKQFQDILGTGRTMIQQTYDRIQEVVPNDNIFVITNTEYIDLCSQQLSNLPKENIVGEPMMKNTAACNLYMANKIAALDTDAKIIVLPADHLILKEQTFIKNIHLAIDLASQNDILITLGITPTRPDTGYGYIQYLTGEDSNCYKVKTFTEKPSLEIAKTFLESGDFLWNAGIFIWSARSIISAFQTHLPEMVQQFSICEYNNDKEANCIAIIYPKLEKISIDNGILEKAENVYVIPSDLGWSDLGTWTSVYENAIKDENGTSVNSKNILSYHCKNNIIRLKDENKALVIDSLENYIVVDTEKALLICPRTHDQRIKDFVLDLKTLKKSERFL